MQKDTKAFGASYTDRKADRTGEATFNALRDAFDKASQRCPQEIVCKTLRIAEQVVRIRIVGRGLAQIVLAPFSHLEVVVSQLPPQLRIDAWDQQATGVACEGLPADTDLTGLGVVVRSVEQQYFRLERGHSSMWLNTRTNDLLCWFAASPSLTIEERSKPFYRLLYLWLQAHDITMIHSGLIARNGHGALLTGKGGVGKSTSVLSCISAGFESVGDDYVALKISNKAEPRGYSLFSSCCVRRDSIHHFSNLKQLISQPDSSDEDKFVLILGSRFGDRLITSVPISVILLPRVTGGASVSICRASPIDALRSVAPSSLLLMPDGNSAAFNRIAELVDLVPAYWLNLGGPIDKVPPAIVEFMDSQLDKE
jgi:hypothetical protein